MIAKQNPLKEIVRVERVAQIFGITGRHMRRILEERGVARAGHGKVELGAGIRAYLRTTELNSARDIAAKWTDDSDLQQTIAWALIAKWRGLDSELAKLAAE